MRGRFAMGALGISMVVGCGSAMEFPADLAVNQVDACDSLEDCALNHVCVSGQCTPFTPSDGNDTPPTIVIESPESEALHQVGETIALTAVVTDDASVDGLLVAWHTNRGGDIGQSPLDASGHSVLEVDDLLPGEHILTASVTDLSGWRDQAFTEIVVDGRPSRPTIRLFPQTPTVNDDLTVSIIHHASDENRSLDKLMYRYRWFVEQVEQTHLTGPTVPHTETIREQSWTVRVSASDPFGYGPEAFASVVIGNTPPTCSAATLMPPIADTNTAFTCFCPDREDLDPNDLTLDSCVFFDGLTILAEVAGQDGACVLDSDLTARGMSVRCLLTPADDFQTGEPVFSEAILVDNAHPDAPTVALTPESGSVTDSFSCDVVVPSIDPDGDVLTYEVAWYVNDYPNAAAAPGPMTPLDLVRDGAGTPARGGDTLRCEVHARDVVGEISLAGLSDTVIIGNSAPTGGVCAITPTEGVTAKSVLNCEASGAVDLDSDPISWTYGWTVIGPVIDPESTGGSLIDATVYPPVTGPKLSGAHFQRDAQVSCVATPSDGSLEGQPIDCGPPVVVLNSMPTIWEVFLEPLGELDCGFPGSIGEADCAGTVGLHEPVTCAFYGWSDPDENDIVEVGYSWLRFGATEISLEDEDSDGFGSVMVPSEAGLAPGDTFTCIARPFNGPLEGEGVYATHVGLVVAAP